jgi:hypothetical protein
MAQTAGEMLGARWMSSPIIGEKQQRFIHVALKHWVVHNNANYVNLAALALQRQQQPIIRVASAAKNIQIEHKNEFPGLQNTS